ncbi:unnamed protein product [Leptidea sinapis]|uniref:Tyr recombinase domain-containing protein n=1 Tax=Leptidea sinapis TaxID=189913 RepID=A0A5E4QBK5_9NEOP|nr:unnamed protein product [Leptidea sinapis]
MFKSTLSSSSREGYTGKKSKTFSPDEINRFLSQAPDQLYLAIKTALIFGTMGACHRQELYALLYTDLQINETVTVFNVNNTKTKTNRTFTITGKYLEIC